MSEVLAKLEKKGGGAFDISTIPKGYCAHSYSPNYNSGITATLIITDIDSASVVQMTPSTSGNYAVSLGVVNATGYSKLYVQGNANCTAFGLNDDGTLDVIYAKAISTGSVPHEIDTQGYKYVIWTTPSTSGTAIRARIQ